MKKILLIALGLLILTPSFALKDTTQEYAQAERYFDNGDYAMAERYYQQALVKYKTIDKLAAYIQNQLAFCLRYQKKTEKAVAAYRELQSDYPNSSLIQEAQEHIARTYYEAGDYAKAAPEFEKMAGQAENSRVGAAVASSENNEKAKAAYGYAAMCYMKSGKIVKANSMKTRLKTK